MVAITFLNQLFFSTVLCHHPKKNTRTQSIAIVDHNQYIKCLIHGIPSKINRHQSKSSDLSDFKFKILKMDLICVVPPFFLELLL